MPQTALTKPVTDPTRLFEFARSSFGTDLLACAVAHFRLFALLAERGPMSEADIGAAIGLKSRPLTVLLTMMRAMGLLARDAQGRAVTTPMAAEHLDPASEFDVSPYLSLSADSPGARWLLGLLRADAPAANKADEGKAFIYREGLDSAMDAADSARRLTLALSGRARNIAPYLVEGLPLGDAKFLVDVAGGSGIFAVACLERNPHLRAAVWDRPAVLAVAREFAERHGVADRLELVPGDMFADPVPAGADVVLLSNVLHDWDEPTCARLVRKMADALPSGGRLVVHDVYLHDALDGPLPLAEYSAALFSLTEGRAYSAAEYRAWLTGAGLDAAGPVVPTRVHCGLLTGTKAG